MAGTALFAAGGYEVESSRFGPGSSEKLVKAVLDQAHEFYQLRRNEIYAAAKK